MNTFKISSIAFILVLLFTGCTEKKATDSSPEEIEVQATPPAEVKITVALPEGWEPVQGSVLEHQYMKGTASFMIKNERILDGKDLNEVITDVKTTLSKSFDNITFSDAQSLQVDNHNAMGLTYVYSMSVGGTSMNMKMNSVYTSVADKCYVISFGDLESTYDALSTDIEQILDGIKFVF